MGLQTVDIPGVGVRGGSLEAHLKASNVKDGEDIFLVSLRVPWVEDFRPPGQISLRKRCERSNLPSLAPCLFSIHPTPPLPPCCSSSILPKIISLGELCG